MIALLETLESHAEIIGIVLTLLLFVMGFLIERKARKIQTALTWKEFRDPIMNFSNEVIFTLSEAAALCDTDHSQIGVDEYWNRFSKLLTKLTSLADQGRLVIPNLHLPGNSAYGGLRDKALDCVLAGYGITKVINYKEASFNKTPLEKNTEHIQYKKIMKYLAKLPNQIERKKIEADAEFKGWSCKYALIEVKRQFVEEISNLIQARQWVNDLRDLAGRK